MKKFFYTGLLAVATLMLGGCSEDNGGWIGEHKGGIALSLNVDSEVTSRAAAKAISVDDLTIRLTDSDGEVQEWPASSFPTDNQFKVGEYTLEAFYGKEGDEGFEKPFYHDGQKLTILEGQATPVSLCASVKNSMVKVIYTESFKKFYQGYSATITTTQKSHFYSPKEERPIYVTPGTVNNTVKATTPQGKDIQVKGTPFKAAPKTEHSVTFNVEGTPGNSVIRISYDESLNIEDVLIDLNDLETAPEPSFKAEGFTPGEHVKLVEGSTPQNPLKVNLVARAGISSVVLETSSRALRQYGWSKNVELVSADASDQAFFANHGLDVRGLYRNADKMAVIDFTHVNEYINFFAGDNLTTFKVTLTDRFNRQLEPIVLVIESIKSVYEYGEFDKLYYYDPHLSFTFHYNGNNLDKNIKFYYRNDRGTDSEATFSSVTEVGTDTYKVVLNVPFDEKDVILTGKYGDKTLPEQTIQRTGNRISVNPNDVFATYATVGFQEVEPVTGNVVIYSVLADGSTNELLSAPAASQFKLTGLTPNTSYKLIAESNGHLSNIVELTTEAATKLPTDQFNEWIRIGGGSNWDNWQIGDGTIWGTNNPMTTSEGANVAYVRSSGTLKTTDECEYNSKNVHPAILLRTLGWGSGNTAAGTMVGKMKYADAGMLHLGASRTTRPTSHSGVTGPVTTEDLDCGLAFESRPSALKFWYKYIPKNSADGGYALVTVYDASGNILATNHAELGTSSNYQEKSLPLSYHSGAGKAAKIYVLFLSTNKSSALEKNKNWITPPAFGNLSDGMYLGSQLYIDDIELTY